MGSSYRRDTGAGNTHRARITLTEVATSTWIGDMEKLLEKRLPFAIHCPSRVCVREPKDPLWKERDRASVTRVWYQQMARSCTAPALAPEKGPGWRAMDKWFLLWWEGPRQAADLETLLLGGNLAEWWRVEVSSSHWCQHPEHTMWPGSFSSFLLALTDSWDLFCKKSSQETENHMVLEGDQLPTCSLYIAVWEQMQ